nr:MAG TPA: Gamma-aminobutyric acid type B receptor(B) receptor, coiled-coil, heterodimer, SIGNALING.62A [Caudoviricetes sp.]
MTAEKDNKVYTIDQSQVATYQSAGFDIRDDEGNLIEYGANKAVPYSDYAKLLKENEELKKQISSSEEKESEKKEPEEEVAKTARKKAGQ